MTDYEWSESESYQRHVALLRWLGFVVWVLAMVVAAVVLHSHLMDAAVCAALRALLAAGAL